MTACYSRHQHHNNRSDFHQPYGLPSPSSSSIDCSDLNVINFSSLYAQPPATNVATPSTSPASSALDHYMTDSFDQSNNSPTIRVHQPTPTPQSGASYPQQSVLSDNLNYTQDPWGIGHMIVNQPLQTNMHRKRAQQHRRAPSSSSIGSSNPTSPFAQIESSFHDDKSSRAYSNHLPTPTQTPIQESFIASTNYYNPQQTQNFESALQAHMALNGSIDQGNAMQEEMPDISHSSRHSVSSYGQEPATPHDYYEDSKAYNNDKSMRQNAPKFERSMTDAYMDTGFDPTATSLPQSVPSKQQTTNAYLSPFRGVMGERLQAAQIARSHSPSSSLSGGVSPFRQGSPLAPTAGHFGSPRSRLGSAAQVREQQKAEADSHALKRNMVQDQEAPKTVSPKDMQLEYHGTEEDSKMPLFPDNVSEYDQSYGSGNNGYAQTTPGKFESGYASLSTSRVDGSWTAPQSQNAAYSATSSTAPQSNFTFQPPAIPATVHGLSFSSSPSYRTTPAMTTQVVDEAPEFPAHLTSMESSASEAAGPSSSNNSTIVNTKSASVQKPASALADTGTYTCTYHGCTQRFETPQRLQRHKREAHRAAQSTTPGVGSGMTSAALLARNSQAGPHKCERINPTTGKPCNTIFSRPYDLTRHEDTIHNVRKQKVRCALCAEEKTFSRNDALTRHMRVVHPDVDFPGKHRRRGS